MLTVFKMNVLKLVVQLVPLPTIVFIALDQYQTRAAEQRIRKAFTDEWFK